MVTIERWQSVLLKSSIREHYEVIGKVLQSDELQDTLKKIADALLQMFIAGNKLLLCGNGGSAADAQHIAAELVGRFNRERKALDAETLTINTSSLTAIGNDYGYDRIFSRQIEAKGRAGDILLSISTSGTSKNIIMALEAARAKNMRCICLTGENAPDFLDTMCDSVVRVPSVSTPRIQECHILFGHILCDYVEERIARE